MHKMIRPIVILACIGLLNHKAWAVWPPETATAIASRRTLPDLEVMITGTIEKEGKIRKVRSHVWQSGDSRREDRYLSDGNHREIHCVTKNHHIFWPEQPSNVAIHFYQLSGWGDQPSTAEPVDLLPIGMNEGGVFLSPSIHYSPDTTLGNPSYQSVTSRNTSEGVEVSFLNRDGITKGRIVHSNDVAGAVSLIAWAGKTLRDETRVVAFTKLSNGSFFPQELTYTRFDTSNPDGSERMSSIEKWKIEIISDGIPFSTNVFDLSGMGIPVGTSAIMFGTGKERFWNGSELVQAESLRDRKPGGGRPYAILAILLGLISLLALPAFFYRKRIQPTN